MTRGFVTIATGKEHYFEIAKNLVTSYRYFSETPLPFAIICDRENEYTEYFDDVIVSDETTKSFKDKFLLLKLCPYDETIFVDADSLCYSDLNQYFDVFKDATDFSAFGLNVGLHDDGVWYDIENIGEYGKNVTYKSRMHAGVIFLRKGEKILKMYQDCIEIYNNYDKLHFNICASSYDEATFAVAMPLNSMKAVHEPTEKFACYPCLEYLDADMLHNRLSYKPDWTHATEYGVLIHFGTFQTYKPLYRFNIDCLNFKISGKKMGLKEKLLYEYKLKYYSMKIPHEIKRFFMRVINKVFHLNKDI